jgi:hypothetical protein
MRLGEWRKTAPNKESMSTRVLGVLRPVLVDLGAESDSECWVAWGDDPESRYSILAPTVAGLITMAVRIAGPDGPRATAKLVRWSKVSVSELSVEASDGHRIVAVQVESLVLKGIDGEADRICEFVRGLLAGIDGRSQTPIPIALVQAAAALGTVVTLPASDDNAVGASAPAPSKALAKRATVAFEPSSGPKPVGIATPKPVPSAAKPASKQSPKIADKPSALALALVPSPVPEPASEPAPSAPPPPTPIAARTAAAQHPEHPATPPGPESEPGPAPDRSEWVGPHPIEGPAREPVKPRPWKP